MTIKFFSIFSGAMLATSISVASAEPMRLSSAEMNFVTAGAASTVGAIATADASGRNTTAMVQTGASSNNLQSTTFQLGYGAAVSTASGGTNPSATATTSATATGNVIAAQQFNGALSAPCATAAYSLSSIATITNH